MFSGEKVLVDLRCDNSLMKTMVDRFGEDVTTLAYDMTSFRVQTEVSASLTFFGWVFGFNGKVQILAPENLKEQYRQMLTKALSYPSQLSGGQKQRVAIARVLASDPQILLCDEATSALDPQTTKAILELIKEINRDYEITVVVITHEMSVVQEICDKVAVLERGALVETGTVEELFRNPKTDEAKKLVFSGRTQIQEMKGKRLVRVTFQEKSSFEPVIANLVLTYRTPVNILYADTKNINGQAQGEMILQLPEIEEVANKMIQYLRDINMGVEEVSSDVG